MSKLGEGTWIDEERGGFWTTTFGLTLASPPRLWESPDDDEGGYRLQHLHWTQPIGKKNRGDDLHTQNKRLFKTEDALFRNRGCSVSARTSGLLRSRGEGIGWIQQWRLGKWRVWEISCCVEGNNVVPTQRQNLCFAQSWAEEEGRKREQLYCSCLVFFFLFLFDSCLPQRFPLKDWLLRQPFERESVKKFEEP